MLHVGLQLLLPHGFKHGNLGMELREGGGRGRFSVVLYCKCSKKQDEEWCSK